MQARPANPEMLLSCDFGRLGDSSMPMDQFQTLSALRGTELQARAPSFDESGHQASSSNLIHSMRTALALVTFVGFLAGLLVAICRAGALKILPGKC